MGQGRSRVVYRRALCSCSLYQLSGAIATPSQNSGSMIDSPVRYGGAVVLISPPCSAHVPLRHLTRLVIAHFHLYPFLRRQFTMYVRTILFAVALVTAAAVVPPSESCCLWGGNGAGYAQGLGTFALPTGGAKPAILPIAIAASGRDAETPFMTIRVAPDAHSADSVLGWHITQNATAQTTVAWIRVAGMVCSRCCVLHCRYRKSRSFYCVDTLRSTNHCYRWRQSQAPSCFTNSVPLPSTYTPGFSLCTGGPDALFPVYQRSYALDTTTLDVFAQTTGMMLTTTRKDAGCVPSSLSAPESPFGSGAFAVSFEIGAPEISPDWAVPPAWCT